MNIIKAIWNLLGNIYFTMGIFLCMVIDLVSGYFMLKYYGEIFQPINDMGFIKWSVTFGRESLFKTAWLFILVFFLALLSINVFVCTTNRVIILWQSRNRFQRVSRFILGFGPHIMHYSMLIMFLGYLVSYLFSATYLGRVLLPEKEIHVAGSSITLKSLDIDYYHGDRLFNMDKRAMDVRADLFIASGSKKGNFLLKFNRPVQFKDMSIHLKDFSPHTDSNGMGRKKFVTLIIKQDPGVKFYFTGMIFFTLGLVMYSLEKIEEKI